MPRTTSSRPTRVGASTLERDSAIAPPSITVINASAGAGKTHVLTLRLIQLLLTDKIRSNGMRNILAITFTKNAAGEMKQRVLEYLKRLALGEPERIEEFGKILSLEKKVLPDRAGAMLDQIFDRYSDLQIQTIDSFMTSVFKAAALEFGYTPDFDVALENETLLAESFETYLRGVELHSERARSLEEIAALLGAGKRSNDRFSWNPCNDIARKIGSLYTTLNAQTKELRPGISETEVAALRDLIAQVVSEMEALATASGLETKSNFQTYAERAHGRDIESLLTRQIANPLKKPSRKAELAVYDRYTSMMDQRCDAVRALIGQYAMLKARSYILPYLRSLEMLRESLRLVGRRSGTVFLEDIHAVLLRKLNEQVVPEIYFTLGERMVHFLIDEFQDTSPIQWANIRLLVENALATEGTLFVVGDTKQSIFGFRGADWTIMKRLYEHPEFPSATHHPKNLDVNYRSAERIIRFTEEVFRDIVPTTDFREAGEMSGLSAFHQHVLPKNEGRGYVQVDRFDRNTAEPDAKQTRLLDIMHDLFRRGYRPGDIAVLTPANKDVVEASGWLNDETIDIISHSSLDVRRRKIAGELIGLLKFLDSPIDDLAFAQFILGDLFSATRQHDRVAVSADAFRAMLESPGAGGSEPAYKRFRTQFEPLWDRYFETLFNVVGYLPLYDLLSEIYKSFSVFLALPAEEAALAKILEAAKQFEGSGSSSLKNFLQAADDGADGTGWEISIPEDVDAVTVMTIHKAKGLQFPVVVILLEDKKEGYAEYCVAETEEGIELLHITKPLAELNDDLRQIYDERRLKERVNMLNGLYVAFTRAQEEMYIIGVYDGEPKIPTMFLAEKGYEPMDPARRPRAVHREKAQFRSAEHRHLAVRKHAGGTRVRKFSQAELHRGELLHRILSQLDVVDPADAGAIDRALDRLAVPEVDRPPLREALNDFLQQSGIREFFCSREGRKVLIEQEIAGATGTLYRADRVVIDPEGVTVIDYKTGTDERHTDHSAQVKRYMNILKDVYTKSTINGVVAYIDLKKSKSVVL